MAIDERVLPLVGARNFRDLGGYPARNGQRTRWKMLFRSDYLVHLTDADCDTINNLGLRTVFDLRSNMERERYPSRWHPRSQVETVTWQDAPDSERLGQRIRRYRDMKEAGQHDDLRGFLSEHYRRYVELQADKYREVLARLSSGQAAPALIHCTAGKDRTGILCALILDLLGVDETTIMQDYLQTNRQIDGPDEEERFRLLLQQFGLAEVSEPAFQAMRYAHAEYLEAAFDAMRKSYGSVGQYASDRLGAGPATIAKLQSFYLE